MVHKPEPASRFEIKFASVLVGRLETDPEGTELFEAIISIDESDGKTICEFEVAAANLALVTARLNCDIEKLDNGNMFVVVGFDGTPIEQVVTAFCAAFEDTPLGNPRYVFELLQGDGTSSDIMLSVQNVDGNPNMFVISEMTHETRPPLRRAQWTWFINVNAASELVDRITAIDSGVVVELSEEGAQYPIEAITRVVTLFPRAAR